MPSSTYSSEASTGLSWGHPGTSSMQMVLHVTSTTWTFFSYFLLCSSPALFNEYADAPQYAMKTNKVQNLLHYLDDYFTVGSPHSAVCTNITTMIAMCEELGFTINSDKVTKPATTTNFLGVDINSVCHGGPNQSHPPLWNYLPTWGHHGLLIGHQVVHFVCGRKTSLCVPCLKAW